MTNPDADKVDGQDSSGFLQNGAAAGGDLSFTYPNPRIATGAVSSGEGGEIEIEVPLIFRNSEGSKIDPRGSGSADPPARCSDPPPCGL